MYNNFSLLKIIGGLSKTLNIANQMIPLYKQVKPLISNSNKIFSNLQNLKTVQPKKQTNTPNTKVNNQYLVKSFNTPTFFQ